MRILTDRKGSRDSFRTMTMVKEKLLFLPSKIGTRIKQFSNTYRNRRKGNQKYGKISPNVFILVNRYTKRCMNRPYEPSFPLFYLCWVMSTYQ